MIWLLPGCLITAGSILLLSSKGQDNDAIAAYLGGALLIFGALMAALRAISPACYDGSLVGEALIRACG